MARCCCGKYPELVDPLLVNSTLHERLGPEGNFCGPLIAHDLRDALRRIAQLEMEVSECRREKQELADRYVSDLGQEVLRLGHELAECRDELAYSRRMLRENGQCPECGGRIDLPPKHVDACYCIPLIRILRKELSECRAKLKEAKAKE